LQRIARCKGAKVSLLYTGIPLLPALLKGRYVTDVDWWSNFQLIESVVSKCYCVSIVDWHRLLRITNTISCKLAVTLHKHNKLWIRRTHTTACSIWPPV